MLPLLLTIILSLAPGQTPDPASHFNRAVGLQQQGRLAEAADEYRAAIKLKPDYLEALANLGVVLARMSRYDEAIEAYQSALKIAPGLAPILINLGIAHYRAGQFEKAAEVFDAFLKLKPEVVQARQLYGLSLSALGRDEEALQQLESTLDSSPPDAAVLYSAGLAYLRLGRPGFRATLEKLAAFDAGRPALHLLQGLAFLRDLDYDSALEELKTAASINKDLPRLHFSLGLANFMLGNNGDAIAAFAEEIRRNPADTPSNYYLAQAFEKNGDMDNALKWVNSALKLDPQSPESNGLLGRILLKQGRTAEAIKPLEFAVSSRKTDHELRYALARAYQQLGRREDAAREFAEVQKLKSEQLKKDRANTPRP